MEFLDLFLLEAVINGILLGGILADEPADGPFADLLGRLAALAPRAVLP